MRSLALCIAAWVALASGDSGSSAQLAGAPAKPFGEAAEPLEFPRALDLAMRALGKEPVKWHKGCDIRLRRGEKYWTVIFEPVPMGPGFDVMVVVHDDGSTIVAPGY